MDEPRRGEGRARQALARARSCHHAARPLCVTERIPPVHRISVDDGRWQSRMTAPPVPRQAVRALQPAQRDAHPPSREGPAVVQGAFHGVGPNCAAWPSVLTERIPTERTLNLSPDVGRPTLCDFCLPALRRGPPGRHDPGEYLAL
jgi:hypothetical protein